MHRADKPSDAMQRCERALSRPSPWIESPKHVTRQDKLAAAERQRAVEAMRAEVRAMAQREQRKEAEARAAEAAAEKEEEEAAARADRELAKLREDVVAWR